MAIYYVSPTGNDDNAGTEANPFLTSAKLATVIGRGDTAFFQAGGTYDPLIITSIAASGTTKITIGRYGTGPDPVFSAFINPADNWVSIGGNKWTYNNASFVTATVLTIANDQKPFGKFPETALGTIQSFSGSTQITDTITLDGAPDLVGAELVVKKRAWTIDRNLITEQTTTTLTTASDGRNYVTNYGWFAQNNPNCLFKNGDWCYVDSTKTVHLYSTTDPNTLDINISFSENALRISGTQHVDINNCKFVGAYADNVFITSNSHNVKFDSCHIQFSGTNGLRTFTSNFFTWTRGIIENTNNHGIIVRDASTDATITKSKFQDNAIILGMGGSGNGQMCGVFINNTEHRATISENYFNRSGNCSVYYRGDDTIVNNNYATKAGFLVGDAAAFYTFGRFTGPYTGIICRRNIAFGCNSNNILTTRTQNDTCGFYTDDNSNDILLEENYAYQCGYGLYIHNTKDSIYRENILIDNDIQIRLADDEAQGASTTFRIRGLNINNNTIKSLAGQKATGVRVIGTFSEDDPFLFGIINNNKFDNADASPFNVELTFNFDTNYTLATWRSTYDFDINSSEISYNQNLLNDLVNITNESELTTFATIHDDWDDVAYEDITLDPYESILLFDTEVPVPTDTYTLTLDINPVGFGTAEQDPIGPHEEGTEVILTAAPASGKQFVGWYDGETLLSTNNPYTYTTLSENKTITAEFENEPEPDTYTLTILTNPENGGTASGSGTYEAGTVLNLEAVANEGFVFTFWDRSTSEPLGFFPELEYTTRSQNDIIIANFDEVEPEPDICMEISHMLRLAIIETLTPLVVEGVTIPIFDERVNPAETIPELLNGISYVLIRDQQEVETTNDKCAFRQNAVITLDCVVKYPVNVGSKLASELISCEIQSRINRQVPIPGWQVLVVRRVNATSIVEQGITQTAYRKLITFQFDVYKR
jgi:parallel beta-helix repeat protein